MSLYMHHADCMFYSDNSPVVRVSQHCPALRSIAHHCSALRSTAQQGKCFVILYTDPCLLASVISASSTLKILKFISAKNKRQSMCLIIK